MQSPEEEIQAFTKHGNCSFVLVYPDQFLNKPFFIAVGVFSLNLFFLLLQNFVNYRNYQALNDGESAMYKSSCIFSV